MTEEDEHVYKLCAKVGPKKDTNYWNAKRDIKRFCGKDGLTILNYIFRYEQRKALKWIINNKQEYLKKLQLKRFDCNKLIANQISIKQYQEKWRSFVTVEELEADYSNYIKYD